jgi:hypothetical protein
LSFGAFVVGQIVYSLVFVFFKLMFEAFIFSSNYSVMVWNVIFHVFFHLFALSMCSEYKALFNCCFMYKNFISFFIRIICICVYERFAAVDVFAVSIFTFAYFGIRLWFRQDLLKYTLAIQFNNFRLTFLYLQMLPA